MTRNVLAVLSLAALFCGLVVFAALSHDDGDVLRTPLVRATPPDPAPTFPPPSTQQPDGPPPGSPFFLSAMPTPEPAREGPESTLVEVATGRSLRLWQPGRRIGRVEFSPDGRWLVYDVAENAGPTTGIYRIDLTQPQLEPLHLSDGSQPHLSVNNDIAFTTPRAASLPTGLHSLHVLTNNGKLITFDHAGAPFSLSWSRNGRWLAFLEIGDRSIGEGNRVAYFVGDVRSGQVTKLGLSHPSGHGRSARWSPVASRLIYGPKGDWEPLAEWTDTVYDADTATYFEVPFQVEWLPDSSLATFVNRREGAAWFYDVYILRPGESSATRTIRDLPLNVNVRSFSPDLSKLAYSTENENSDGHYTHVITSSGTPLLSNLDGGFSGWTPDGRRLITSSTTGSCVYSSTDGQLVRCITGVARFSPKSTSIAYVKTTAVYGGPIRSAFFELLTNELRIVDLDSGQERTILTDARGYLDCVQWSPDARWIALTHRCDSK